MNNGKRIAVIPARAGSTRIKNKNIVDFCGKPLIAYTIESAISTGIFDRVIVSTDSEEISEISKHFGAEVPFLRKNYADNYSPVSEATLECVESCEKTFQESYDSVCQLFTVTPLRQKNDILSAYDFFEKNDSSFLISCFRYPLGEPYWARTLDAKNVAKPLFEEEMKMRSQDLPPLYCPTGAIWIAKVSLLKQSRSFYGPNHQFFPMSWINAVDIDTPEQLDLAKVLFQHRQQITTQA